MGLRFEFLNLKKYLWEFKIILPRSSNNTIMTSLLTNTGLLLVFEICCHHKLLIHSFVITISKYQVRNEKQKINDKEEIRVQDSLG